MPAVSELADLRVLVEAPCADPMPFPVDDDALAVMTTSLDATGLLLLGEIPGVRQTPQLIARLVEVLDPHTIALEWPRPLTDTVDAYRTHGVLDDHPLLWLGSGQVTAGHRHLLRTLAGAPRPVGWLAFDPLAVQPTVPGESEWTARDHAMARHVLDHTSPAGRTLVVAGNAHTPTTRTRLGLPMGAWLARARPGLQAVTVRYGDGAFYNFGSGRISRQRPRNCRLRLDDHGGLVLDHPSPAEASVPHRHDPGP